MEIAVARRGREKVWWRVRDGVGGGRVAAGGIEDLDEEDEDEDEDEKVVVVGEGGEVGERGCDCACGCPFSWLRH